MNSGEEEVEVDDVGVDASERGFDAEGRDRGIFR